MDLTTLSIITAFAMIYVPRFIAIAGQLRMPGGYDYGLPRDQQHELSGIYRRAQAAHLNGIEGFAPFAVAALLAAATNPSDAVAQLAMGYALTRVLFVAAYLADLNPWRTVVWMAGLGCNIGLFVLAVNGAA